MSAPTVHFEPVTLIGRVYYDGTYEARDPFDAVFSVLLLGEGRAKVMAAHGKIDLRAYGQIARQLRAEWGVTHVELERHGHAAEVCLDRASEFGGLDHVGTTDPVAR